MAVAVDYTKYDDRLAWIHARLSSVPEGAALLDLAAQLKTVITFDVGLNNPPVLRGRIDFAGSYTQVLLNPFLPDREQVQTLAHELRHLWQRHRIGELKDDRLKPLDQIILNLLVEGDANAFAAMVVETINRQENTDLYVRLYDAPPLATHGDPARLMADVFAAYQKKYSMSEPARLQTRNLLADIEQSAQGQSRQSLPNNERFCERLTDHFNNLSDILKTGGNDKPFYLDATSAEDLADRMTAYLSPDTLVRARQLARNKPAL